MKILVVCQYFWPENFGINALTQALVKRGIEVDVLTGKPNYPEGVIHDGYHASGTQKENYHGATIFRVPLYPRGSSAIGLFINYLSFILSGLWFGPRLLKGRQYDLIFVFGLSPLLQALPALWLARLKRLRTIVWVQDLWPESLSATGFIRNRLILAVVEQIVRFIYRHTDHVLVQSEAFVAPIERLGVPRERISYYPNAYHEDMTAQELPIEAQGLVDAIGSTFSIVFGGNLGAAQSLETIVEAARLLQEQGSKVQFVLIGSGGRSDWLREQIDQLGLRNILLPGRFSPEYMPAFYAAASVLLVSLRDEPIFSYTVPSKVQGYLAAGRPIIASLNGEGARIVIESGAGVACPSEDARAMAQAVLAIMEKSAEELAGMGEAGRNYFHAHFEPQKLVGELLEFLTKFKKEGSWR